MFVNILYPVWKQWNHTEWPLLFLGDGTCSLTYLSHKASLTNHTPGRSAWARTQWGRTDLHASRWSTGSYRVLQLFARFRGDAHGRTSCCVYLGYMKMMKYKKNVGIDDICFLFSLIIAITINGTSVLGGFVVVDITTTTIIITIITSSSIPLSLSSYSG